MYKEPESKEDLQLILKVDFKLKLNRKGKVSHYLLVKETT